MCWICLFLVSFFFTVVVVADVFVLCVRTCMWVCQSVIMEIKYHFRHQGCQKIAHCVDLSFVLFCFVSLYIFSNTHRTHSAMVAVFFLAASIDVLMFQCWYCICTDFELCNFSAIQNHSTIIMCFYRSAAVVLYLHV